jgi:filamentous hemagglutinin family protein
MNFHRSLVLTHQSLLLTSLIALGAFITTATAIDHTAQAQVATSITSTAGAGNLGTTVTQAGALHNITGGTRAGTNLFHSFGNFSVGAADTANFLNTPVGGTLPLTSNILGRVTGGNISNIFGTIQTTGFGNANLFLMNPAGFLFGPNATVNVGGMATFTSADYIKLADGRLFNAIPDAAADALLSAAPVAAFGFLGSNPGAITVQGSQLAVSPGQGISLVGGNITVQSGTLDDGTVQTAKLSAPGGQINLVSVASPGEVLYPSLQYGPNVNGQSFTNMSTITVSEGSVLDVSADSAGTIKIRGGQFIITDGTLSADTGNTNGAPIGIDINVTGDLSIADTRGVPAITARTTGTGDAGAIQIASGSLTATSSFVDPNFLPTTLIDSHTSGDGRAGDVRITTGDLSVVGPGTNGFTFIDSGTMGNGRGGNVTIDAKTVDLNSTSINTGQLVASALLSDTSTVNGSAGNLTITADSVKLKDSLLDTSAFLGSSAFQKGGDITISARDISMSGTLVGSTGTDGGGTLTVKADTFVTDASSFETDTISGPGGGILVDARVVELTNGSALISTTIGDGNAGNITIIGTDHVSFIGNLGDNPLGSIQQPTGLFSNSFGRVFETFGGHGNAGDITVTTPWLEMNGGRINTATSSSGSGGNVTLNVSNGITISGEFSSSPDIVPSIFDIGQLAPSGVVTQSIGSEFCTGSCGNAGHVSINTGSLSLGNGGQINSGTNSTGRGGDIVVNARDTISISGTLSDGSPVGIFSRALGTEPGSGQGGNISVNTGQSVSLSNGASIAASSTGPANAGNIFIDAGHSFTSTNSSVTTQATQASGGNITVLASDLVYLTNSQINASVQGSQTTIGGNIVIDPNFVILQNSQILAQATQGQGGNISITTNSLLTDADSFISASSQSGVNGTVNVQSPISQAGGKIIPLSKTTLETVPVLSQRCAALTGGQYSSFLVAGRETLPTEPGGWLATPLMALSVEEDLPSFRERMARSSMMPAEDGSLVSLRRLPASGARTTLFSSDWPEGCGS